MAPAGAIAAVDAAAEVRKPISTSTSIAPFSELRGSYVFIFWYVSGTIAYFGVIILSVLQLSTIPDN